MDWQNFLIGPLRDLLRLGVVGTAAYAALVFILRISGKRTLSKLNAFDLVVTVALGSTLATVLLSKTVALLEGVAAFALLVALQWLVTWTSVRWPTVRRFVAAEPSLLLRDGAFLDRALRAQRLTREEVLAAMRASGHDDPTRLRAVVLETDGSISVVA